LKDGGLLGHKYLSVDADYNFSETIAKVELAETPRKYSPGVRYHKRFTFLVFKDIALSFVALSTGMQQLQLFQLANVSVSEFLYI
jgi:hypothetical protein